MLDSTNELFAFDFVDFRFVEEGDLSLQPELRLLGSIIKGRITKGLPILVPTANGPVTGIINQFMETFDYWVGLPFLDRLTVEGMPDQFCLCIIGIPSDTLPVCPGTAHNN